MKITTRFPQWVVGLTVLVAVSATGSDSDPADSSPDMSALEESLAALPLRALGPALQSGRIADIAVDPTNPDRWYVAAASGGVWKTVNHGTTWTPIFDDQPVYSIGCVTIDPRNPHVVWVGTGENNSQRSVGWGDGVYKSLDGGETFVNVGLERSEHIGKIVIDPRDSDVVWVAAQGPLWSPGGDRGLFKTTDGGATWENVLSVSENTGISDIAIDPRDPETVYAASYQRRRRQWALVAGGPESAIFKSTDGGATWRTLERGLPAGPKGRIGIAISPVEPDVLYATIPGLPEEQGFFRSSNRGESWTRMSDWVAIDPQYYQELFPDPHQLDRVYAMDVLLSVTHDGGKTFEPVPGSAKHVDNHALVIDPKNPDHLISGTDGGLYESFDRGRSWRFFANLPITQFYRIGVDDQEPFYWVYGGTQDNDSVMAPSRTTTIHGLRNSDWIHTSYGDGYQSRVEPGNADIVYTMWQYGELMRYDRTNGEMLDIKPLPEPGEAPFTWNWDAPMLISPHAPTRLYFAGNRLFRSDDRGSTWTAISDDLSRGIDRNTLPVMGRVWSVDAVWKNVFTSFYGNATALDESPIEAGLLYVGTDDGLIHTSEDGGATWRRSESFPAVPDRTLVADVTASRHDADVVYALLNNHKSGDFTAYVLVSHDRGRSWRPLAEDLPAGHVAWSLVEDREVARILFLGTELGLWTSLDSGEHWSRLGNGLPTVGVRDLEIQDRADDLVIGTFGRGIYVLEDLSVLRHLDDSLLATEGSMLPIRDTLAFVPSRPMGWDAKGVQGDTLFQAPNPAYGATLTFVLGEGVASRRAQRLAQEADRRADGDDVPYPPWDDLRAEDRTRDPEILIAVRDADDKLVATLDAPTTKGLHRTTWNLRRPTRRPIERGATERAQPGGAPVPPGRYSAQLLKRVDGVTTPLGAAQTLTVRALGVGALMADDRIALATFQQDVEALIGTAYAVKEVLDESIARLDRLRLALDRAPDNDPKLERQRESLRTALLEVRDTLVGDETVARRAEPAAPSLLARLERVAEVHWYATSAPTATHRRAYVSSSEALTAILDTVRPLIESTLPTLEAAAISAGVPWTSGSGLPSWPR